MCGEEGGSKHIKVVVFFVESVVPFHQNTRCLVAALHSGLLCLLIG